MHKVIHRVAQRKNIKKIRMALASDFSKANEQVVLTPAL
jgi:hypothetical protein